MLSPFPERIDAIVKNLVRQEGKNCFKKCVKLQQK